MSDLKQAALAALEALAETAQWDMTARQVNAVAALRAALAEPGPGPNAEPVAWRPALKSVNPIYRSGNWIDDQPSVEDIDYWTRNGQGIEYAYSAPPAERRPMTGEEAADLIDRWRLTSASCINLIRAVERHHGIGGSDE